MEYLKIITIGCLFVLTSSSFASGMEDDPVVTKVMGEVELRSTDGANPGAWNIEAWIGKDLNKFWVKTKGERVAGHTEKSELQWLYSKAVTPFWDLQFGVKQDFQPKPKRHWGVIAAKGLAPYLFEVDASLFVGESGRLGARLDAEYEYMLSQKLILSPEVEINAFSKDDELTGTGKGLSSVEAGLRLRYEVTREFAPYIGINWEKKYGKTADFSIAEGEDIEDAQIVVGVRFWF
ncbi:copper resistance protein B [bacterium endosymbiont of Bathymodiolus sp. 5 South]|jgi:copper resistance protein B|uniref:copper resistance protein B n=1 Tax=bacterium endosymbiont of Bathymodiolus sp. 5 South TaxID=1181670 RepID=UPI0010BC4987|nr:copper resistance protein B [bacterium endosymbiont of Bathymodiolus sp. 5 South]CAC9647524.1 Copper resistance protein B [uncultured Gammaproteobacteria bacterium]CAC9650723.1 Copper resistance protein B [uncultured Gammaproteobacteria bacterium]SHN90761.1 Copper resistance protein B [bacterium endosymbiont of Bathymodiolus sp. 5 South]SSC06983.1 Copper resistance protein B [bacterium endosymbiont of Bathymodiolus sp. 5 South]VVH56495.1 Copper resistance protein B [uncultured Gammaproteoba